MGGILMWPRLQTFAGIMPPFHLQTDEFSDAGRDWGQEEKGMTEDEMAGWHH